MNGWDDVIVYCDSMLSRGLVYTRFEAYAVGLVVLD